MKAAFVGWMIFNTAISAVNVFFAWANTRRALRNTDLAQANARNAKENLREHKASMSLTDDVMSIARRLTKEQQ